MIKHAVLAAAVVLSFDCTLAQAQSPNLEPELVFASLGGSVQTGYQKCVIDGFEKKFNVRVNYVAGQTAENMAKLVAQRSSPTIDVYLATDADQFRGVQQGLFDPVTVADVPSLAQVSDLVKDDYGVPIDFTMAGIGYNTKVFAEKGWAPPTSWNDLWDPKYQGHVSVYTASITYGIGLLEVMASLNGGDASNLDPGFAKITELKPNLYAIMSTQAQLDQALTADTVWISVNSNQRVLLAKQQGAPVEFVQPSEGVMRAFHYLDIVKGAPHPNAARAFLNWMLEPEVQACIPETVGVSPVLSDAQLPAELALYYKPSVTPHDIDWPTLLAQFSAVVARWQEQIEAK